MVFWFDLELRPVRKFSREGVIKAEKNLVFNLAQAMLPKENRTSTREVEKIFKEGQFAGSSDLTFKYLRIGNKRAKISFITPKNTAQLAVQRNLLRRRGYSALERHLGRFPAGLLGVFIFKKYQDNVSILSNEIKSIIDKVN